MSRAGGIPGFLAGIVTGAATAFTQLAQTYLLGPLGSIFPGTTPAPGRPHLTDPAAAVQAAIDAGLVPDAGTTGYFSDRYICIFTDADSGESIARIPIEVDYPEGTPRSTVASRARREALRQVKSGITSPPLQVDPASLDWRNITQSCRRIGRQRLR